MFSLVPARDGRLLLVAGLCLLAAAAGCHRTDPAVTASASTAGGATPDATVTPSPERDFVNQVKAMPANQRQAFIAQHPDMLDRVQNGGDPMLASELTDLIPPPSAPVQPPVVPRKS